MTTEPSLYESFALYGSGVTLVAVRDGDYDRFFVAASVLTASVTPFTLAVSVGQDRDAIPAIQSGAPWTLSVLAAHHLPLVRTLTAPTTHQERLDALGAAGAESSPEGPLWLPDALVTFWCSTRSITPVHDQRIVVGEVQHGSFHGNGSPLLRWNRDFRTTADVGQLTSA
ncbi:flavin reductase family protein [Homoserinibacter sp. GY 40078]|uniref:flavin reductase family protein n=1 Tax=Homoserinibacter sp. GY 40078 TaxID=2603275 RepID=UPI0011C7AE88|nr:flavin reductase family protein [Homoserinibacter sp. GY 40078]TXK19111.1 flavin reductase [Homoserinibacter sp. GY 40078]